jgi:hypothetical protein
MKAKSRAGAALGASLVMALAVSAAGCGTDATDLESDIDLVQSPLAGFVPWQIAPVGSNFQPVDQYGPSFVSKKSLRIWAFTVPYDNTLHRRTWQGTGNNWQDWTPQNRTNVATKASGCNWLAGGGVEADRNVVVAYVGWDGRVRVGHAMGNNYDFTWNTMADTDVAPVTPAIAITDNNVLHLFVKKTDGTVRFKRNTVTYNSYSFSNWSSSWGTVAMPTSGTLANHVVAGGVAAAKTGSNTITVAASVMHKDTFAGTNDCVMANIPGGGGNGTWSVITSGGCRQQKFSTPAMTASANGGRIVVIDQTLENDPNTTLLRTATSSNGTTWSSFTATTPATRTTGVVPMTAGVCTRPTTNPAVTQSRSDGEIAIGAGCDGNADLRWTSMRPF